ncbi:MAG TPA: pilus assembly protein N-terminal domain-containing protein [Polyangiaceae bacterium]|nr:pilus assembly protein N-terminal domain-containing protein [Polyangiaceae bacterium]
MNGSPSAFAERPRARPRAAYSKLLSASLWVSAVLLFPSVSPAGSSQRGSSEAVGEVSLSVGETRTLPARDVKNYSEGVQGVIDIKLTSDASQFVLVGRKPGSTTLLLIKNDGSQSSWNIHVFSRAPERVEQELRELLNGLNVRSRRIGSQIVLDGVVANDTELSRVQRITALYPEQVISLVQLATEGVPSPQSGNAKYLIRIDFYFVQYDKNSSYGVGLAWPDSIAAGAVDFSYDFLANTARAATASVSKQPLPSLDLAARRGYAKVLKQAAVVTNNDNEANFSNGGEQNFTVNTGLTVGVQRIPFGTDITVLPHYDPDAKTLSLKLAAEVSDLTASVSGTALPGRSTSRLTTQVSLKLGQSLVLSGIHSHSLTHSVSGLPGLSQIPILGILFGSHTQAELETEGAIFVVPSVVQSLPNSERDLVDAALKRFETFDGGDLGQLRSFDRTPHSEHGRASRGTHER